MTWETLFERAERYEVSIDDITATLEARRDAE